MENQDNSADGVLEVELEAPVVGDSNGPPPGTIVDGKVIGAPEPPREEAETEQPPPKPKGADAPDDDDPAALATGWKQRARREERRAKRLEGQFARTAAENAELKARLERLEQGHVQVQQQTAAQHEQAVDAAYQTARAQLLAAKQAGDVEGELSAQERFLEAKAARDWVNFNKANGARQPQRKPEAPLPRQPTADAPLPEAMQEWLGDEKNAWFKSNPRLKRIAMAISDEVLEEGLGGDDPEHYAEVTRRMKEELGDNFTTGLAPPKPPGRQPITPVNRTNSPTNKVPLTNEQRQAAVAAGINLSDPAELKAFAARVQETNSRLAARGIALRRV